MKIQFLTVTAMGVAAVIVGSVFTAYQLYKLVEIDAESRGLKRPRLWGVFSLAGNNGSGLLLYLLGRRKYPVTALSEEGRRAKEVRKKKLCVSFTFQAVGAIVCVLSMFLAGEM